MKKKVVVACAALSSLGAWAQNQVTVYGMVDQFIQYGKSGSVSFRKLQDGGDVASRIGFRGIEDLGGGLRAHFVLEAGFNADTGEGNLPGPGLTFTRQSYLGIGNEWGSIEAGRMYMPLFYSVTRADPFGSNAVFSPLQLRTATDAQPGLLGVAARADDLVRYRTSPRSPFIVDVAYAFGETVASGQRDGEVLGGRFGWDSKGTYVAYSFQLTKSVATTTPALAARRTDYHALSASYDISPTLRLNGNLIRNSSTLPGVPDARVVNVGLAWRYNVSNFMIGLTKRSVAGSPRGQTGGTLGYNHDLSKRTALYGRLGFVSNRDKAAAGYGGVAVQANSGNSARTLGIGISHKF